MRNAKNARKECVSTKEDVSSVLMKRLKTAMTKTVDSMSRKVVFVIRVLTNAKTALTYFVSLIS